MKPEEARKWATLYSAIADGNTWQIVVAHMVWRDAGDHVHHAPTGEDWIVAFVENGHLYWLGWPPGRAELADCTLVRKATPQQRKSTLISMAGMNGDVRGEYARRNVLEEKL